MKPKEKQEQIERGENWIVEFWRVRGYSKIQTCLGISYSLHKSNQKYEANGLDLNYLEQFEKEVIRRTLQIIRKQNYDIGYTPEEILKMGEN
jgi:hypothetical protein